MEDTIKDTEEEQALVMDPLGTNVSSSPVDENLLETTDDLERTAKSDKESLLEEMNAVSYSSDITNVSDPAKNQDGMTASVGSGTSLNRRTAVKLVPRSAVSLMESTDLGTEVSKQIPTKLVLPSLVPPEEQLGSAPKEPESEAGDCMCQQEVSCATTQAESDSVSDEESLVHLSIPNSDTDEAASEPLTYTVSSLEKGDEIEEVTCCSEEACVTDVCTEQKQPSGDGEDCLSCVTAEEMVQNGSLETPSGNTVEGGDVALEDRGPWTTTTSSGDDSITEDETLCLREDTLSALQSDAEPQTSTAIKSSDLNSLVEEVTCLVGEICLTDVCRDLKEEAEMLTEECELQEHPPSQQNEVRKSFDDSVPTDELPSP
ncbi:tudor domain-containing 6 isoform X4 [Oreochromis niloticus]|nr:uncharacterized protein LOC100707257 isoform X4 [Oreochromis niloticus]